MELDITKPKKLVFGVSIANVDITNVRGVFVLFLDDLMNIGFPTTIEDGKFSVTIPPLVGFDFKADEEYKAELWVIADRDYFTVPWSEGIIIKKPIEIKAKVSVKEENEPYILVTKPIIIKE